MSLNLSSERSKDMRKDQCLFCTSRKCPERVVSLYDKGKLYDEIACVKHIKELYKDSDDKAPKVMKIFSSSTGRQKRSDVSIFNNHI